MLTSPTSRPEHSTWLPPRLLSSRHCERRTRTSFPARPSRTSPRAPADTDIPRDSTASTLQVTAAMPHPLVVMEQAWRTRVRTNRGRSSLRSWGGSPYADTRPRFARPQLKRGALLAWRPHPGSEALVRCRVLAPIPQDRLLHELESLGGDEAWDRLLPAGIGLEGDHDGHFSAESTGDLQQLVRRWGPEHRILKTRRATDEERIVEDQLQTMVVGQIMPRSKPELPRVPGKHVPVPPRPLGKPDRRMPSLVPHPQPPSIRTGPQATQRLKAPSMTG